MFYERQNEDYDGGKIKVTSKDIHMELTLKWIPNNNCNSGSAATSAETTTTDNTEESATTNDNDN